MAGLPETRTWAATGASVGTRLATWRARLTTPQTGSRARTEVPALLGAILLAGLALRLALLPVGGFPVDQNAKRIWADRLLSAPTATFYASGDADALPPGEVWVLWFVANAYHLVSPARPIAGDGFSLLLKSVPALADLAVALLLFLIARRLVGSGTGLLAAAAYAFNPAALFLSVVWGGWGALPVAVTLGALLLLLRGNPVAFPLLTFAVLLRPSFAAVVPFFVAVWVWHEGLPKLRRGSAAVPDTTIRRWRRAGIAVGGSILVGLAVLVPFGIGLPPLPTRWTIGERVAAVVNVDGYAAINAFTLWWPLAGNWAPDGERFQFWLSAQTLGVLLLIAASATIAARFWRTHRRGTGGTVAIERALVWAILATTLAWFVLPTRVHERDIFPVVPFAVLGAALVPRLRWPCVALSATCLANLAFAYDTYAELSAPGWLAAERFGDAASLLNVAVLGFVLFRVSPALGLVGASPARQLPLWPAATAPRTTASVRRLAILRQLALPATLVLIALAFRLPNIEGPDRLYFDEIYFVTTAQEYAVGNPDAHINYVEASYGSAYEWTHPPLGKIIIASGILLFGDNPVGWRLPGMLIGALGIAVAYRLGWLVTGRRAVAVLVAGLLAIDGLYLVMTRIGTVDGFVAVFVMSAMVAFHGFLTAPPTRIRGPLLRTGLFLGLAVATKWNSATVAGLIGLVVLWRCAVVAWRWWRARGKPEQAATWAALRAHLIWVPVGMAAVPLAVYFLAYVPFFLTGHTVKQMVDLQQSMYRYHSGIIPSHVYRSRWWEWPLWAGRMWFHSDRSGGAVRSIYVNGNPLLFFAFVPAVVVVSVLWIRARRWPALTVVAIGFLGPWLFWAVSPRAESFIYHFLIAVPYGCLALAAMLGWLWQVGAARGSMTRTATRAGTIGFVALAVIAFLFFYPLQTAQPLTEERTAMRVRIDDWWRARWD